MMFEQFLSPLLIVVVMVAGLFGLDAILLKWQQSHSRRAIGRQVIMLAATLFAIILLIILLPIEEGLRGQILSLLGLLLSATIALSSTTFLGNALAGILLRSVRSFRIGDFIYINEQFGRVSDRGLFHIEIQTEDSDLVTLPNLYVTNNAVKVTRESGTIISSEISLGYDISRNKVEEILLQAASTAGLQDPFVYVLKLGDFSVHYRVNGMLVDVKQLLSKRSRLNAAVLDSLHAAGIEIVSPNFMNTRDVSGQVFLTKSLSIETGSAEKQEPEDMIFDKAEEAASLEDQKDDMLEIEKKLEALKTALKSDDENKAELEESIKQLKGQRALLRRKIEASEKAESDTQPPA